MINYDINKLSNKLINTANNWTREIAEIASINRRKQGCSYFYKNRNKQ